MKGRDAGSKPIKCFFIGVTGCDQNRSHIQVIEMNPTCRRTGELTSHQPEPNNSETDFCTHRFSSRSRFPGQFWCWLRHERCSAKLAPWPQVSRVESRCDHKQFL